MAGSKDFTHIVNNRHFNRIKKMLDESTGEIKVGGKTDESQNFIEVTVVKVKDETDALLRDEIFGPVLPYVVIDDLDEAIDFVNRVSDSPLALYAFTKDNKEADKSEFSQVPVGEELSRCSFAGGMSADLVEFSLEQHQIRWSHHQ